MAEELERGGRKEAAKLLSSASSTTSTSYSRSSCPHMLMSTTFISYSRANSFTNMRRHETRATAQPSVTQRLSDILRNRRLRIGRAKTTTNSLSDSLTLSESNNSRDGKLFRTNSTNSYQSAKSGFSFKSNRSNMTTLTTVSSLSGSSNTSGSRSKRGKLPLVFDLISWCYCREAAAGVQV